MREQSERTLFHRAGLTGIGRHDTAAQMARGANRRGLTSVGFGVRSEESVPT